MARIVHTADVHLTSEHPEREAALAEILSLAEERKADLVTIGGDLFESAVDAQDRQSVLEDLFTGRPFSVLAIPGNHDEEAFRRDLFFGETFRPAVAEPFEHVLIDDSAVRVTCLPHTKAPDHDLLVSVIDREPFEGTEILLLHCHLEAPFQDRTVGEEQQRRYFPISKHALAALDFDYYLAGHYHAPHRVELPGDLTVAYPGTPSSVTEDETGPRNAVVLDTEADRLDFAKLEAFHYDSLEVTVWPDREARAIEEIETWANVRADRNVEASITVTGYSTMDPDAFAAALESASRDIPVSNRTSSVAWATDHPLYRSFDAKLGDREFDDDTLADEIRERTLRVFSELGSGGRLT